MSDTAFFTHNRGNSWRPAIIKGALAFLIGALTALATTASTIDEASMSAMGNFRWMVFWSSVLLSGCVNLRSFIDESLSRQKAVIAEAKAKSG